MTHTAPDKQAIEALLTPIGAHLETLLHAALNAAPLPNNLREAARYALLGPGKRLRPALVILSARAVAGREPEAAWTPAVAMEMIHAFSLVHDDLPAMDNDDFRRGRPTLHRHTNDAMAILTGDLLQGLAMQLMAARFPDARMTHELAAATNAMIAGQVYDTLPDFPPAMPELERLQTIHQHKTGALLRCSCRLGAMAAGADETQLAALTRYGEAIGLMFQAVDDLLDVTQSTQQLGKTAGKDVEQGKLTYPALLGLEGTRRAIDDMARQALDALAPLGTHAHPLRDLCRYMAVREK